MTLTEQVFAQAAVLAGELEGRQVELLEVLCTVAVNSLQARLRDGLTPDACKAEFVAAASLLALAAMDEAGAAEGIAEFRAGDLTVKRKNADTASRCLQRQAERMMQPYLKDGFAFWGV